MTNKLNNPCSISDLLEYAKNVPFDGNNLYIDHIHDELIKLNSEIDKYIINAIFNLFSRTAGDKFIDAGCAVLAFATLAKETHKNVYIMLNDGAIAVPEDFEDTSSLELKKMQDLSNSLKHIIAEIFVDSSPKEPGLN